MATLLQRLGSTLGLGDSHTLVSGNLAPTGTQGADFHLDIHQPGVVREQIFTADEGGSTITASNDARAVMLGDDGNDRLIGGDPADFISGGAGLNVLSGGGGTDVFGHGETGLDIISDFSPAAGERIALPDGISFTGSATGIVDPAPFGLPGPADTGVVLDFSDGSHVVLPHFTETPQADWFI